MALFVGEKPAGYTRLIEIGDAVHYVLPDGPRAGECRPGVVIRVTDPASRTVVLYTITDGLADSPRFRDAPVRLTAREEVCEPRPGSWHFKEACRACRLGRA